MSQKISNERVSGLLVVFWLFFLSANAYQARADDSDDARRHFVNGKELMKLGDYAGAAVELERSVTLQSTKNGLFNLANCYKALYRYDEALKTFARLRTEQEGKIDSEMLKLIEDHEKQIRGLIAKVTIVVNESGAEIRVDGTSRGTSPLVDPIVLGPGVHVFRVEKEGYSAIQVQREITAGMQTEIRLDIEPAPRKPAVPATTVSSGDPNMTQTGIATPSDKHRRAPGPLFWTLTGLAVVGSVPTGALWYKASAKHDVWMKYSKQYTNAELAADNPKLEDAKNEAIKYNKAAIAVTVVTSALAVAAIVVLIVDLNKDEDSHVAIGPGQIDVRF